MGNALGFSGWLLFRDKRIELSRDFTNLGRALALRQCPPVFQPTVLIGFDVLDLDLAAVVNAVVFALEQNSHICLSIVLLLLRHGAARLISPVVCGFSPRHAPKSR
jgi:hypothetical protein